jgi:transposase
MMKPALRGLLAAIDALTGRVKEYDRQIVALAGQHKEVAFIQSIPGVSPGGILANYFPD